MNVKEYNTLRHDIIPKMLIADYEYIDKDTIQFYYKDNIELEDGTYSNRGDIFFIPDLKNKIKLVIKDKIKFRNKLKTHD